MAVFAAVMTGQGMGAIATIQLVGAAAEAVLRKIFRRKDDKPFAVVDGRVLLGGIVDDGERIDEVTIGCEGPCTFAIHCHGNPLIAARIMEVLRNQGVQVVPAQQLLARILTTRKTHDAISIEAKLALTTVKAIEGATIVANQVKTGLLRKVRQWQDSLDSISLEEIAAEARDILKHSEPARLIISGCTIALIGPPNTGKSTLLNTLAGREKAIVSDIRGTTRDWVSAEIHIPPLAATIIDTAGLDGGADASGGIDQAAQQRSMEIANHADLVLLVLDLSQPADQLSGAIADLLAGRRTITVFNKADLPLRLDSGSLPEHLRHIVRISAKLETGIEDLIRAIHETCGVAECDPHTCVAFTDRQMRLLRRLCHTVSKVQVRSTIIQLLEGTVSNFAAHFDMLGFGSAVQKDFHEAWGALSDLWYAMDKALCTVPIPIATGMPLVDRVRSEFFSDSVILYTPGDSDEDLIAILIAAATLFGGSLRRCVPLRGGIGHGRFQMDPSKRLFMGESLVKAHRVGENAQWLGIVLDEGTAEVARKTALGGYVVDWDILGKDGVTSTCTVVNWMKAYVDAGSLKKAPITLAELYQPFERLFGPYAHLSPEVKRKYESTVAFMNVHLSNL